ncbi:MAG: poly(ethylene terephthalate) hydrolase family protein [Planctomycetota bacterium]
MRGTFVSKALTVALLLVAAPLTTASDLAVQGQSTASQAVGLPFTITLDGAPGQGAWLLFDTSPGPTVIFGQSLPLGFTPQLTVLFLGPMPGSGTLAINAASPLDDSLEGLTLHLLGAVEAGNTAADFDFSNAASITFLPRSVQLAGEPLLAYPWFQRVRAFNFETPVRVAVDPSLHPEVVGRTGDVHVVAKKTAAQWAADPSLTDLTAGGPESFLFTGAGVQANTLTVDAGSLAGDAGLGLGVPYDVVVDLNQNGIFDNDDLIDGFGAEAGLYVVDDVTRPGPLAVTEILYSGGTMLGQNTFYPTDIATMGQLPLVVVSHGNGHNYQWYDHIGNHLASYGYIVMSHQNNTVPGVEAASTTTLTNTDYFLSNLGTIQGGVLNGHVDKSRMTWIGHSRGGEGVVRAYDRVFDGTYVPTQFVLSDVRLVSSIAPTDFLGTTSATPHGVDYHLWVGGADADVTGCASNNIAQSFHLHDRAEGKRMSTSLHGVGHGDFHNSTGSVATGPCLVGKPDTHKILKGYLLPLVQHHIGGSLPAEDFLWRQWESFRPIGAPTANACVVVDLMYRDAGPGKFVIDDAQTNTVVNTSSSGGAVTFTVAALAEARLDDTNADFTWGGDNFNGFTHGQASDTTRGLSFEYNGVDAVIDFALVGAGTNAAAFDALSFRAAQITRHPFTTSALGDTNFTVVLIDGDGDSAAINIAAYGGGVEEPYQRTSCGTGAGWGNEFETIRIRLTDFMTDGSDVDLDDLATVSLRFGPSWGSPAGKLGLDDLEFTKD